MSEYPTADDCIFCKIVAGDVPAALIFEDDNLLGLMDAFPSSRGHALVIPKGHYPDVHAMPPAILAECSLAVQRLARAAHATFEPDGISILQFNGAAAGQGVFHYHQHVVPRWEGQDWQAHGEQQAEHGELLDLAASLRKAYDAVEQ